MKDKILIDPNTGQEYIDVPPTVAAKFLDVALNFIYEGLKKRVLPIGTAVQSEKGRWTYNIPCERLKAYAKGVDISLMSEIFEMLGVKK